MRGIVNITLIALLTTAAGCNRLDAIEGMELGRELDTSKTIKVLVTKEATGAGTADVYRVYATAFANDERGEEILRTDSRDGVAMDWVDEDVLRLTITCGRVFKFRNVFELMGPDGKLERRISMRLAADGPVTCS